MAVISGTNLSAPIVPQTTEDKYGTHYAKYGIGGKMEAANIAERDAIPTERRNIGMFVTTQNDGKTYQLKGGVANSNWVEFEAGGGVTLPEVMDLDAQTLTAANDYTDSKVIPPIPLVETVPEYIPPDTYVAVMDGELAQTGSGRKYATLVVGTTAMGHTEADVDILCTGFNDAEAILQALSAIPAAGGKVVFREGTYNIEKQLVISRSNTTIEGVGTSTVLKRMYNETGGNGLLDISGSYITIQNCAINGNRSAYTATLNHGVRVTGAYVRLIDVRIHDTQNGIWGSGEYSTILRCVFNGTMTRGIYFNGSKGNISHNAFAGCSTGINLYGATAIGNILSANNIENAGVGILLQSGASRNQINGNTAMRGTGLAGDYTADQYTIRLADAATANNLVTGNMIFGKDVADAGTGNTLDKNKYS